ncbi:MAG TPA: V-type ATP synthase subunit F [Thermoplasmata archaeon]|nr:V-type ATP synthase subunit F [Thermoplasmata archaeon]
MTEVDAGAAGTVVLGERELATGFRLIGMQNVIEIGPESGAQEFQRVMADDRYGLVIASQSVRRLLSEAQRQHAEASLKPLVVFVPPPSGEYEVESLDALAKRVLGVSLSIPK